MANYYASDSEQHLPGGISEIPGFDPDYETVVKHESQTFDRDQQEGQPGGGTPLMPANHHLSHEDGGTDEIQIDAAANLGSMRTLGSGALQAAAGSHTHAGIGGAGSAGVHARRLVTQATNTQSAFLVNSTSYLAASSLRFLYLGDVEPATHFRIVLRGATNEAAGSVILQLATEAAPATPLSAAGDDLTVTGTTNSNYDSGWVALTSAISTEIWLVVATKGSNTTVDLSWFWLDIMFKNV